jgi:hypothetical protein
VFLSPLFIVLSSAIVLILRGTLHEYPSLFLDDDVDDDGDDGELV